MSHMTYLYVTYLYVFSIHEGSLLFVCGERIQIIHKQISHVTHMNESYHTCKWVMSHTSDSVRYLGSYIPHTNESFHTYDRVMSHMNGSCHTHQILFDTLVRVFHIQICHVTRMNESCLTYEWVMSHIWMSHVTHLSFHQKPQFVFFSTTPFVFLTDKWVTHTSMKESCHTSQFPFDTWVRIFLDPSFVFLIREWVIATYLHKSVTHLSFHSMLQFVYLLIST